MWSSRWKGTASRTAETTRREKVNACDTFYFSLGNHGHTRRIIKDTKRKPDTSLETMGNTKKDTR